MTTLLRGARLEERACVEHLDILAEHMHALRPWTGEPEELRTLCLPDIADIACCKGAIDDVERRVDRHQEEIGRLSVEITRLKAEVEAAGEVAGVVSDQQAASIRAEREEAWAGHKRTLDVSSAEAFEATLRRDDIVTNSRDHQRHGGSQSPTDRQKALHCEFGSARGAGRTIGGR